MSKILVVEDDPAITDVTGLYLENEGYDYILADTGEAAISKFNMNPDTDLIILDLNLPGMDGLEVLKNVRKESQVPVIIVTARDAEIEKIQGLMKGADDYLTKPYNPLELMARIRSILRRATNSVQDTEPEIIDLGIITINKDSHVVKTAGGEEIGLTALEFGILYLLASKPGQVYSADEIFEKVWKTESVVSAKTVMVHLSHLRDKIKEATGGDEVVQTVWGVGYKVESR
ncbi:MAG: response regulator transcription factor [Lactobacillaceae bacterium]|jgi:DNA-binding response OmpR family regulator|nr:response regulator transcription factor [Lactobacillaceae bacterium]